MTLVAAALLLFLQGPPAKASIEGFVVRAGTSEPISRARVTVSRNGAGAGMVAVNTDEQGRFVVKDVDAGTYYLAAQRNGYVRQLYGERAIGRPGRQVTIAAGQVLKDIVFHLTPAGAVTGRITDGSGEPLPRVTVQLWHATYQDDGQRRLEEVTTSATNDRGEYRLFFVSPGRYFVSARGGYAGPLLNDRPLQPAANEVIEPGYGTTYYPGTDASGAVSIEVQAGAELSAVDFSLRQEKVFRIRGKVVDAVTGQVAKDVQVITVPRNRLNSLSSFTPTERSDYNSSDGSFEIRNVVPGAYFAQALLLTNARATTSAPVAVDVSGNDVENIVLTLVPGFSLPGQIVVEDGTTFSALPDSARLQVVFTPTTPAGGMGVTSFAPVLKNGSFVLENLKPGDYQVSLIPTPPGTYLKEARLGQVDIRNGVSITAAPSVPVGVEILLSPRAGEVTGTILDQDRKPVGNIQAVLIPSDRHLHDLYRTAISDADGQFSIRSIVPGDYKLFAWEDIEPYAYMDSDFLRRYEEISVPVRISESGKESIEAKVIPAGR